MKFKSNVILVKNLGLNCNGVILKNHFNNCGRIRSIKVLAGNKNSSVIGVIAFESDEIAAEVINNFNKTLIDNNIVDIDYCPQQLVSRLQMDNLIKPDIKRSFSEADNSDSTESRTKQIKSESNLSLKLEETESLNNINRVKLESLNQCSKPKINRGDNTDIIDTSEKSSQSDPSKKKEIIEILNRAKFELRNIKLRVVALDDALASISDLMDNIS